MSNQTNHEIRIRRRPNWQSGQLVKMKTRSQRLANNLWGDPIERETLVYLPPGYDESEDAYPSLWYLAAFTNSGASANNWRGFGESLCDRIDRLIFERRIGPVILVAPDCFTTLGGNQYLNSAAVGRYDDYIHDELIPQVDERFRTHADPNKRACFGKSSGGYGALRFGMLRPEHWGAVASHAGDVGFDWVYRGDFPTAVQTLRKFDYDLSRFLHYFWQAESPSGNDFHTLMVIAMAASYDPDPALPMGFGLPFDPKTLEIDQQRWQRWLTHDPLTMIKQHGDNLKKLAGVYIDVGDRDQYNIQYGSRVLHRELKRLGIVHHYEEFDGTHSGIDHRFDESVPYLYRMISQAR